ncbi:CDP-alcohol phosphatidyltransferase family protein [Aeromicrobium wangtongii]|uniref:CDP-alcohol phosphatidyltransferase family protein n=1 Tax=Aeromicrobium wangtongii TaxID=2969247 RepID=UPI002017DA9F|nr:CDP-alcohol phosphatidyltransferase family protein [Aeromicrobium wangtongii]MCL3817682.1 CDP-alcohol phosphatidyltransferase family protein [Aeromicrobium wangtongii]
MMPGRRRPARRPSADEAVAREQWSTAHGGVDPEASVWIAGWLSIVHRLTGRLAGRHIPPGWITATGLVVSLLVPLLAWAGDGWPLAAAACAVAAAVLDGVDGALARWEGTESAWGRVLDDVADRCSDLLMLAALALLGAPVALCAAAGIATLLLESARASARGAGLPGIGAVTVWERPSRVIVAAFGTGLCGVAGLVSATDDAVRWIATAAAAIAVLLSAAGLLHLLVALRRALR